VDVERSTLTTYVQDTSDGRDLTCFEPSGAGSASVVLRIRVPFIIGSALLQAKIDVLTSNASARLLVARNDPNATDPELPPPDGSTDPNWMWLRMDELALQGIGGGETDISRAVRGGNIVFIKAILSGQGARFLSADSLRPGGRPVLILDCYRSETALPDQPRPTFAAFFRDGAQIITFTRTLPPDLEKSALATAGAPGSAEYLNYADDNGNGQIDEGHRPLAGRAQVVYRIQPHADAGRRGLGIIRRAFEAPLRREASGSLPQTDLSANVIRQLDEIHAHDFIPSALHLGMSFWGADTTTWEDRPDLEPGYSKYDDTNRPRPASQEWLSSRYLPEQVRVTVVLEPDRGKRTSALLSDSFSAAFPTTDPGRLYVGNTWGFDSIERPSPTFLRDPRHFLKVNDEWIYYSRVASTTEFVIPKLGSDGRAARGARGTRPDNHGTGAPVYRGFTTVFTVPIPAYRHWQR
jgi:hypothetical protein